MYEECVSTWHIAFVNFRCVFDLTGKRVCISEAKPFFLMETRMCFWNNNTKGRKHACMRNVFFCVSYVSPFPVSFSVSKAGFPVQKVSHGHGDCDTGCSCLGRGAANGSVDDHGSGCGRWCGRVRCDSVNRTVCICSSRRQKGDLSSLQSGDG